MFMDVVGPENQAIGSAISNSLGYLAAAFTTYIAATVTTTQAFLLVVVCSVLGLVLSGVCIHDTREFFVLETPHNSDKPKQAERHAGQPRKVLL